MNMPVYDPHSKSYFELTKLAHGGTYDRARRHAKRKSYKGARGRLAIIRSGETQRFLLETFDPPSETWIGLRMNCHGYSLHWVNGEQLDRHRDYTNWGRQWFSNEYQPCRHAGYAGVVIGYAPNNAYHWVAMEPGHGVGFLFIEYPTGQE